MKEVVIKVLPLLKALMIIGVVSGAFLFGLKWYESHQLQQKTNEVVGLFMSKKNNSQAAGSSCEFILYDTYTRPSNEKNIIMTQLEGFKVCQDSTSEFVDRIFYAVGLDGYARSISGAKIMIAKSMR